MNASDRHNVTVHGGGSSTLMFSHGFGCDQNMWRHAAFAFTDKARVVLFDHVGSGKADNGHYSPDRHGSLQGYAADVIDICIDQGLSDVVFVGHSVSATIGVLAAVARPDLFSQLVLVCPSPRFTNCDDYFGGFPEHDIDAMLALFDDDPKTWSEVMAPAVVAANDRPELAREWRETLQEQDLAIARAFARVIFKSDHRDDYRKVTTPTLIIDCTEDSLAPPNVGQYVQRAISNSQRKTIETMGHCPHITEPDRLIAAMRYGMHEVLAARRPPSQSPPIWSPQPSRKER